NGSCYNHSIFSNGYTGQNRCSCANPCILFDVNRSWNKCLSFVRKKRMPFGQEADFRGNQYTIFNGNSSEIKEYTIEIDKDASADFGVLTIIDIQRCKYSNAFVN